MIGVFMYQKKLLAFFAIATCINATLANGLNGTTNDLRDTRCKKEVTKYIDVLKFVRQSAGEMISAKVMVNYVDIDKLTQIVSTSGYCAGAVILKDTGANR